MNKAKQRRNQERRIHQAQKKRERKKKVLHSKRTGKVKKKLTIRKVTTTKDVPLTMKIRYYIYGAIQWIKRAICLIGIHDWKICSGREENSMFACIKCWKNSKKKWGKGGSEGYYNTKHKDKLGVTNAKNWEKKEGKYYFKGEHVDLTKEEVKKLEIVLGKIK